MRWTSLPEYLRANESLGTVAVNGIDTAGLGDVVHGKLPPGPKGTHPEGVDRVETAVNEDFGSFLGDGRKFDIKSGGQSFEATVRARLELPDDLGSVAKTTGVQTESDMTVDAGTTSSQTATVSTAGSFGGNLNGGPLVGPYGTVGLRAPLATPSVSRNHDMSSQEQRNFRSLAGSSRAEVPVKFDVELTDAAGNRVTNPQHPDAPSSTTGRVELQIPHDLGTLTKPDPALEPKTPPHDWGAKLDHPGTEAVIRVEDKFDKVAARMHPSITRLGAPGRDDLRRFLSPANIRNNFSQMLHDWVLSEDLVSEHGSRGSAVQMKASLGKAELVGVTDSQFLRVHESSTTSTSVAAATKSGFEANAAVGGSAISADPMGGAAGLTGSYSSHTTAATAAGVESTSKIGMQVKGDIGLYKVHADLTVLTQNGNPVHMPATAFMRVGLPEAAEQGLPVPPGTRESIVTPAAEKRFPPPYLADKAAMGDVKVSEHGPTNRVLPLVQAALGELKGFKRFLPEWTRSLSAPEGTGRHLSDEQEKFNNQRKLTAALSPPALRTKWDSLIGPGVDVQLKKRGWFTNDYTNIKVKAHLGDGEHLGEADNRKVRASTTNSPKADTSTIHETGWSAGIEGRVLHTGVVDHSKMLISPTANFKYIDATARKQSANPTVSHDSLAVGSSKSQVFRHDTGIDIEVTTYSRPRAWVKRLTPGSPLRAIPEPKVLARTMQDGETPPQGVLPLPRVEGHTTLWVPDGATSKQDLGHFKPDPPKTRPLGASDPRTIQQLLSGENHRQADTEAQRPRPARAEDLRVEAVSGTDFLRDRAIKHINEAAGHDSVLGLPGSESRKEIDGLFSPERIAANLDQLRDHGMYLDGLHYDRRVFDRIGSIGMAYDLKKPVLVSMSDDISTENSTSGGYKVSENTTKKTGWEANVTLNDTVRPETDPTDHPSFVANAVASAKPWSRARTKTSEYEISGSVERTRSTPEDGRTALVRWDADVTLLAESHQRNFVHSTDPKRSGEVVTLPGGVFRRVSEDHARELGLLPERRSPEPDAARGMMSPPRLISGDKPSSLGLGMFEDLPDMRDLLPRMREELGDRGPELLPDSVLDDGMRNLHKLVNLTSPAHVLAMQDSAMDGGIPLVTHTPSTFGKKTYWSALRMKLGDPEFVDVVNDGVTIDHTVNGSAKNTDGNGKSTGWNAGLRAPAGLAPNTGNPKVSTTTGTGAGVEMTVGQTHSTSTSRSHESKAGHTRTGSGPAARYRIPAQFELLTGEGDGPPKTVTTKQQTLRLRLHADNQSVANLDPTERHSYAPVARTRDASAGLPDTISAWHEEHPTKLPATAAVEAMRGATDVQKAALTALSEAGLSRKITGQDTPAAQAVHAALSPEVLQPSLAGMGSDPLRIPHLHTITLLRGEHANVEVHRRLTNPRLVGVSDNVNMMNPNTETTTRSTESKHANTGSLTGAPGAGRTVLPDPDPGGAIISTGGAEFIHSTEASDGSSGGSTGGRTTNVRPEGRSGLVEYDVDYRAVAKNGKSGHELGVVDLHVPGSAQVRLSEPDLNSVLHKDVPDSLGRSQDALKEANDAWRAAELKVGEVLHGTDDRINEIAPRLEGARRELGERQADSVEAGERVGRAETRVAEARSRHDTAQADLPEIQARANAGVDALTMKADAALAQVWETGAARSDAAAHLSRIEDQGRAGELSEAQRSYADAVADERLATANHTRLNSDLRAANEEIADAQGRAQEKADALQQAQHELREAQEAHGQAQTRTQQSERPVGKARNETNVAERELDNARSQVHDAKITWWDAKTNVDRAIREFNDGPVPDQGLPDRPAPSDEPDPSQLARPHPDQRLGSIPEEHEPDLPAEAGRESADEGSGRAESRHPENVDLDSTNFPAPRGNSLSDFLAPAESRHTPEPSTMDDPATGREIGVDHDRPSTPDTASESAHLPRGSEQPARAASEHADPTLEDPSGWPMNDPEDHGPASRTTPEQADSDSDLVEARTAMFNRPRTIPAGEVPAVPMHSKDGSLIGVAFPSKQADARYAQSWAHNVTDDRQQQYNQLHSGQPATKHSTPYANGSPERKPLYINAHANPRTFSVDGYRVDGAAMARILLHNNHFREALDNNRDSPLVLLSCDSGRNTNGPGAAHDFAQALRQLGEPRTVYAPTRTLVLVPTFGAINIVESGTLEPFDGVDRDADNEQASSSAAPEHVTQTTPTVP